MDATVTMVVLAAALMHAAWNALVKSSSDRLVELTLLNLTAGAVALALLPFVGLPERASLPYLLGTLVFHCGYYVCLLQSYARGGLSLVYPIARGASPVLVALASMLVLDERLNATQGLGVALITVSIASLAFSAGIGDMSSKAVLFALGTSATIAGYTITDGSGARIAGSAASYVSAMFVLNSIPLLIALPILRPGAGWRALTNQWKTGLVGGALSIGAYGLAIWAMTRAPIALVSALRETSVVLAAILGATLLGEPFGRRRVLAAIGVAAGVIVLRLGS